MDSRRCHKCNEYLDISLFSKHPTTVDGLDNRCGNCRAKESRDRRKVRGQAQKDRDNKYAREYRYKYPEYTFFFNAKARAKKEGFPFTITRADIVIPDRCPVFDIPLIRSSKLTDNSPTLDKIIPELGYVPGNVAVISHKANKLKSNGLLDEFIKLITWLEGMKSNEIVNIYY